jgi:hypothetical protein
VTCHWTLRGIAASVAYGSRSKVELEMKIQVAVESATVSQLRPGRCKGTLGIQRRFYTFPVTVGSVRTFPCVLVVAGLLQSTLPSAPQTIAPDGQATSETGQETNHGVEGILATILQSGSTNTRAYKVVIHHDGSATAETSGASSPQQLEQARSQQFPPGTIDTNSLRRLLREIGDVSKIPTRSCAKSVSFGTRTQIRCAGKISGDLQCIRQQTADGDQALLQASEDLSRWVHRTLSQLKVNDRRISSNE